MRTFQGSFLVILGIGLLAVAWSGLQQGRLPFGSRGFSGRLEARRDEKPHFFWFAFLLYVVGGAVLVAVAVCMIAGHIDPLPLR